MSYVIYTDSGCDIKPEVLCEWGVKSLSLTFRFTDEEREYTDSEMPISEFYAAMRAGRVAKTAAVNTESFKAAFENEVKVGNDVLYIGFSAGLSSTYNSGRMAAEAVSKEYPDSKLYSVSSLCASAGQGLLVYLVNEKKKSGATIEEAKAYAEELAPKIAHWFTVEDLVYLKRGGRVSPAAAFFGNLLGIKPVLHVDDEGKLIPIKKVRGRRTSLLSLVEEYGRTAEAPDSGTVFISCADCHDEAEFLASEIKKQYGAEVSIITDVGAVIGSHSGPGTMALFFVAKER